MADFLNGWGRGTWGQLGFGEGSIPVEPTAPAAGTTGTPVAAVNAQAIASVGGVINSTQFKRSGRDTFSKFMDDGKGVLRLVDVIGDDNIIVNTTAGTVDYETGEVNISDFDPEDSKIGFIAIPDSFDVLTSGNYLLQISVGDSTVIAIDKNDKASLNLFNVSRAK